jgi:hemerythrin superfamily protein
VSDAIKLLETDHRQVEDLFAKADSTSGAAKAQVVGKICRELTVHAEVEEQIVYPAMREAGLDDIVSEAELEHRKVKDLVARLEGMDATSDEVDSLISELKGDVVHHVQEEERTAFPRFRDAVDPGELEVLGSQLEEAKERAGAS